MFFSSTVFPITHLDVFREGGVIDNNLHRHSRVEHRHAGRGQQSRARTHGVAAYESWR